MFPCLRVCAVWAGLAGYYIKQTHPNQPQNAEVVHNTYVTSKA